MPEPMVPPSLASTVAFLAVVAWVVVAPMLAAWKSGGSKELINAALIASCWMALTGAIAPFLGGALFDGGPPRLLLFFASLNLTALCVAFFSSRVLSWARTVPMWSLVAFQGFRLPLELVLHQWWKEGVVPVQMTFAGQNLDIVTGVLAILVGVLVWRGVLGRRAIIAVNAIGLFLLLNVIRVVVQTSPTPLRAYHDGPVLQLAFHFPYVWIGTVCVVGAMIGHVVLFRRLFVEREPQAEADLA